MKVDKIQILNEIIALGVSQGDTVFLAADLLQVGYFKKNREQTMRDWVDILLEVVGPNGTLVIPAYTKSFFIWSKDKNIVFSKNEMPNAGALSMAFYKYAPVQRSLHPTNSCFAVGPNADYILEGHDENSSSYLPYKKLIDLGAKHLMVGGFADGRLSSMAFHSAQEELRLTEQHWCSGLLQSYFESDRGEVLLFTRKGIGGCTAGGYKAIGHHILKDAIRFGRVGRAMSAYIDCGKSHKIYVDLFKNNPVLTKCDNRLCPDCYGSPIAKHPIFWVKKIISLLSWK